MKHFINYLIGSQSPKTSPSISREGTEIADRRKFPRLEVPQGVPLEAEFITQDEILWETRCIDISSEGAQIECSEDGYPKAEEGDKALLKLQLGGVKVDLPTIVMSREKNRINLFLPLDMISQNQEQEEKFFRILLTLDRAIRRRKFQ
ncbi:PilZ domain-containing protein [Candidatus Nitronereus thalassa]|uniref:PilZ domain-containing protein n=1 Tax=Candidatus Nitronereus thalassa TaxID=3020898 RepID=A0ABU3K7H8_9BACT|nr:PilZ domain-containing protein [Candidatus Nitronereus thalassa]MDT7042361.1 PilZ domain-containing protein [Candidatus Nitronereus thalassa]